MKKHIKVNLTKGRSETIEIPETISAEGWLAATRRDGSKFVHLNVKVRAGRANMEGI